jgi:hypothetical protein
MLYEGYAKSSGESLPAPLSMEEGNQ